MLVIILEYLSDTSEPLEQKLLTFIYTSPNVFPNILNMSSEEAPGR